MTYLPKYRAPFIFANFNGTSGDVDVVTHECGHAFQGYVSGSDPIEEHWDITMETAEIHSMSMEFFADRYMELFLKEDADRYRRMHLEDAAAFIPYGCMVDEFQHIVYEKPDMTPAERHGVWKELLGIYMPWMKLDGDIPFYAEGEGWQRQHHIYSSPFYYIDYCLAQTVSLQFWALLQKDQKNAWEHYMAYTRQGGSRTFTELLKNARMESPFEEKCLRTVAQTAKDYLEHFDLSVLA